MRAHGHSEEGSLTGSVPVATTEHTYTDQDASTSLGPVLSGTAVPWRLWSSTATATAQARLSPRGLRLCRPYLRPTQEYPWE